jgi:hypothetical protein
MSRDSIRFEDGIKLIGRDRPFVFQVFSSLLLPCLLADICQCAHHNCVWGSGGTAPPILHVGIME